MKFMKGVLTAVALLFGGAVFVIFSGWYDVAALHGLHPFFTWALHTTMRNSVRSRAAAIVPPAQLAALASKGFQDFDEMCAQCHGAPGKEPGEVGQGLAPKPPSLTEARNYWSPAQIFWIVKNGVHMTGMPAFGPTHDDARIWQIVAFVNDLPSTSAEQYEALRSKGEPHQHDHTGHENH